MVQTVQIWNLHLHKIGLISKEGGNFLWKSSLPLVWKERTCHFHQRLRFRVFPSSRSEDSCLLVGHPFVDTLMYGPYTNGLVPSGQMCRACRPLGWAEPAAGLGPPVGDHPSMPVHDCLGVPDRPLLGQCRLVHSHTSLEYIKGV